MPTDAERIAELERVCAELYQVLAQLAMFADVLQHKDVQHALDNASLARLKHKNLLPWPKRALCRDEHVAAIRAIMKELRDG